MYTLLRNKEARSCKYYWSGKGISIAYSECACIFSPRYPACNAHELHGHVKPFALFNNFPTYLINGMIFEKEILKIQGDSIFSTGFV